MIYPSPTLSLSTGPRRLCPAHTARHVQSQDRAEDRDSHRDPEDHDDQGQAKEREQECDVLPPRDVDALHSQRLGARTGRQSARLVAHESAVTGEADGARDGKLPCARPIDFALVLDESGSMSGYMEGKNGLKAFAKELVRQTAIEPR